jgi:tRNA (guanine37-N1)-methyltransferase
MAYTVWRTLTTAARQCGKLTMNSAELPTVLLPPINRGMKEIDRAFFRKHVPIAAARIINFKDTHEIRTTLLASKELLSVHKLKNLRADPVLPGRKCFILHPTVKAGQRETWSSGLKALAEFGKIQVIDYLLELTYDDWSSTNILDATLPDLPEDEKETPTGFAQVGHVAHLNLRSQYLPYKNLIGQVIIDKSPNTRTVINKTLDVGTESAFRTFPYEVLAGPDDLNVEVSESGCHFSFNFAKVYWNPRLSHEHERLVEKFQPGEAVCDVMAGVGPFAIPAGKRGVFVHANDLNPNAFEALQRAILKNKVAEYVTPSCAEGRAFIRSSSEALMENREPLVVRPTIKLSRHAPEELQEAAREQAERKTVVIQRPRFFDHFVMNLPASAVDFLDAFRGLYSGREAEFSPNTTQQLPFIHVHLFQARHDTEDEDRSEICERLSAHLGASITVNNPETEIHYVRLVAPKKKMYCASFRLPPQVAFANS